MDKQQFNKLEVVDQISYVNNELLNGESLRSISGSLKMSKTTIRDRFTKIGYTFNSNAKQYLKDESMPEDNKYKYNTNILQQEEIKENEVAAVEEYKYNTNIFNDKDTNKKIIDIVSKYDNLIKMMEVSTDIQEMLEWYNKQKNTIELQNLKIDSNKLTGEIKTTTVRLYTNVWNEFKDFSNEFKEYKSMDLFSQALIEFMDKYKKILK